MLLAVMVLMVGVTSAQVASITAPQPTKPHVETLQPVKKTIKSLITMPGTVFTSAPEDSPRLVTSTIPVHSTFHPQPTPESIALTSTGTNTHPGPRASTDGIAQEPVILLSTSAETNIEIPFLLSTRNPSEISTHENTQNHFYVSTNSPVGSYSWLTYRVSAENIQRVKPYPLSRKQSPTDRMRSTIAFSTPNHEVSTESISSAPQNDRVTASLTEKPNLRVTDYGQRITTGSTGRQSNSTARKNDSTSSIQKYWEPKTRSHGQNVNVSGDNTATSSTPRRDTTDSIKRRPMTSVRSFVTSPASPVPAVPLPIEVQNRTEIPLNTVESMYNLPWVKQNPTSELFGDDNVLHPTRPSLFSRRTTKAIASGHFRDMKRSTMVTASSSLLKVNEQNPEETSVASQSASSAGLEAIAPTTPVLNLMANHSALRAVSFPGIGASLGNQKASTASQLPLITSRNQSTSSPLGGASVNYKTSQNPLKTSRSQSTLSPLQGASPKTPPKMTTSRKSENQSASFLVASALKLKPKLPVKGSPPSLKFAENSPPEILPGPAVIGTATENVTLNNCTNDYCVSDEEYIDMMLEYMFPTSYEWVLIGMHIIVFVGGLVGNTLVCVAVYRNHSMRTVTNYFIVNLAVADFLVIFLCLPPTVLWDVTETWFMGTALCKIVLYFQTVSVAVSVLTLTFISVDRWYAICCPLKFKSTTGRAKTAILAIWVLALAFDIPELVVLQTKKKELNIDVMFFTQCEPSWSDKTDMAFHCLQTILLYTLPLIFMSIAYFQIVRVLWSTTNIPGHKENLNNSCHSNTIEARKKFDRSISVVSTTGQVICRRKAAKMLVAVVIVFAVCYFPVHLLSILRYTLDIPQTDATTAFAMVSHWLCYANSAVNPLIYNFMSGKFRKEFANAFGCRRISWKRAAAFARRRRRREPVPPPGDRRANRGPQRTEMVPLSDGCANNVVLDVEVSC